MTNMDLNALAKFLYHESQVEESVDADAELGEALQDLFEAMADIEALEIKAEPLEKALSELGIEAHAYTQPSGSRVSIEFEDPDDYRQALSKLMALDNVNKLAELGWVALGAGDVHMNNLPPRLVINFTEITDRLGDEKDLNPTTDDDIETIVKNSRELSMKQDTPPSYDHNGLRKESVDIVKHLLGEK